MQFVSQAEKEALEKKREGLYKMQLDVQDRIRKAAALGDLSENAEYHFAKEENRSIQRELAELELKLRHISVVATDNVPENVVFIGHTVKLLDLDDDSEQLVRLVGRGPAAQRRQRRAAGQRQQPDGRGADQSPGGRHGQGQAPPGARWSSRSWKSSSRDGLGGREKRIAAPG